MNTYRTKMNIISTMVIIVVLLPICCMPLSALSKSDETSQNPAIAPTAYTGAETRNTGLSINDKIPDLEADAYYNGNITKIKFSDYKGKWLVFIFYPADFTFVCPTELEEMAKYYTNFTDLGAEVFSVSRDTAYAHKAWHDSSPELKAIQYPMIADTTGNICRAFGTYNESDGLSRRATFIFDPDGNLKAIEMNDNNFGRNTKELLRKLEAAKFVRENHGRVCPASWQPGEETIQPSLSKVGIT
ncbi:MAG TPA: redoxin domain-containing protein [Methanocella sp.]|nr:redoxin domain-containing protein [Methanocella sp.]